MNSLIDGTFLETEVLWGIVAWRLVAALAFVLLGAVSRWIVKGFIALVFRRWSMGRLWAADATEFLPLPVSLCLKLVLWCGALLVLDLPSEPVDFARMVVDGFTVAISVSLIGVAFAIVNVLFGVATRMTAKSETRLDDQLVPLLRKTLKGFIAVVLLIFAANRLGYSAVGIIGGLGIGGLALALAAKDTVANFFGSLVVFTDRPFHVGDHVEIGGVEGSVEEVGIRTTRIRRFDKAVATVPNQEFAHTTIINYSLRTARKVQCTVRLDRKTPADNVEAFVQSAREALAAVENLGAQSVNVYFTELAEGSLNVSVIGLTEAPDFAAYMQTQQEVLMRVLKLVEQQGLDIAFPLRAG